jgi:hypothetical protein
MPELEPDDARPAGGSGSRKAKHRAAGENHALADAARALHDLGHVRQIAGAGPLGEDRELKP